MALSDTDTPNLKHNVCDDILVFDSFLSLQKNVKLPSNALQNPSCRRISIGKVSSIFLTCCMLRHTTLSTILLELCAAECEFGSEHLWEKQCLSSLAVQPGKKIATLRQTSQSPALTATDQ